MRRIADLFEIHGAKALLDAGGAGTGRMLLPGKVVDELLHAGSGEEDRRIVVWDERGAWVEQVSPIHEEVQVFLSYLMALHNADCTFLSLVFQLAVRRLPHLIELAPQVLEGAAKEPGNVHLANADAFSDLGLSLALVEAQLEDHLLLVP
jgi:hypothetical protein